MQSRLIKQVKCIYRQLTAKDKTEQLKQRVLSFYYSKSPMSAFLNVVDTEIQSANTHIMHFEMKQSDFRMKMGWLIDVAATKEYVDYMQDEELTLNYMIAEQLDFNFRLANIKTKGDLIRGDVVMKFDMDGLS